MRQTPRVFISYAHEPSPEHAITVLMLSDTLRTLGVDCIVDQYEPDPAEGWPIWMERQIKDAEFVLIVGTEGYLKRFQGKEATWVGKGGAWESVIIRGELYDSPHINKKFIPVFFSQADHAFSVPRLNGYTRYTLNDFSLDSDEGFRQLYRLLTDQPATPALPLGKIHVLDALPTIERQSSVGPPPTNTGGTVSNVPKANLIEGEVQGHAVSKRPRSSQEPKQDETVDSQRTKKRKNRWMVVLLALGCAAIVAWANFPRRTDPPRDLQECFKQVATILKRNEEKAPSFGQHNVQHFIDVSEDVVEELDTTNIIEFLSEYVDEKEGLEFAVFDLPEELSNAGLLDKHDDEVEFKSNDFFVGHLAFYIINRVQDLGKANDTSVDSSFRERAWKAVVPLLIQYFRKHWDHWNDNKPSEDELVVNGEENDSVLSSIKPGWYGIDWNLQKSPLGSQAEVTWHQPSREWRLKSRGIGFLRNTIAIIDLDSYPDLSWTWNLDSENEYDNRDRVANSPGLIKLWLVEKNWLEAISLDIGQSSNSKLRILGIYYQANKIAGDRKYPIEGLVEFPNKLAQLNVHLFDIENFAGKVDRDLRQDFAVAFPELVLNDFVLAAITIGTDHPENGETNQSTLESIIFKKPARN